jgi:asparagine synthase (glutamine-hydrolysing)
MGKHLLRSAMKGLVPDVIRARRDKIGFDVPVAPWLARIPGLAQLLESATLIPAVRRERARELHQSVVREEPLMRRQAFEAWRLVTLSAWVLQFGVTFF